MNRSLVDMLGIRIVEATPDRVVATMPVDNATRQPFGFLHGGASVALAETVASIGAWQSVDQDRELAVGVEINANHVRSKRDGLVTATATPLHKGRSTMVWDIRITDEQEQLISVARCTIAVRPRDGAHQA